MPANSPTPDGGPTVQGPPPEPLNELTLGRRGPSPVEAGPAPGSTSSVVGGNADLDVIEARSRLKAEAARRASGNQRRVRGETGSHAEIDQEIAGWAERLTDCFYWMETPDGSTPDPALLDDVGGCFEAVAVASSLVAREGRRGSIERSLPLLAEAQSALRRALQRLRAPDRWPPRSSPSASIGSAAKQVQTGDDIGPDAGWERSQVGSLTGKLPLVEPSHPTTPGYRLHGEFLPQGPHRRRNLCPISRE